MPVVIEIYYNESNDEIILTNGTMQEHYICVKESWSIMWEGIEYDFEFRCIKYLHSDIPYGFEKIGYL